MTLPVDVAILIGQEMPTRWTLLGHVLDGTRLCPVYACGNCHLQRYTLVTGAPLPNVCPKCRAKQSLCPRS